MSTKTSRYEKLTPTRATSASTRSGTPSLQKVSKRTGTNVTGDRLLEYDLPTRDIAVEVMQARLALLETFAGDAAAVD